MTKLAPKRKRILRIVLLSIAAVPVLFILYIIGALLLSPVFDGIDKNRFVKLDNDSRVLYDQLKTASGGEEEWQYEAECEAILSGPWPTGEFNCQTDLFTEINTASSVELATLHDKYFPIIDASAMLKQRIALDIYRPDQFGVAFVVSGASKEYTHTDNGDIYCTYSALLSHGQTNEDVSLLFGTPIATSLGVIKISLECRDKAREDWYAS